MYGSMRSPWTVVVWLLGALALNVGISTVSALPFSEAPFTIISTLLLGLWLCLLTPLSRVKINEDGIKYRGLAKFWSVPRSEIASVDVATQHGAVFTSEAPVVKTKTGDELPLLILAGYSVGGAVNRRVISQADRIHSVLNACGEP